MNRILASGFAATALALSFGIAQAQTTAPATTTATTPATAPATAPVPGPSQGSRPAQTGIDDTTGRKPQSLERAENSRPAKATKRVAKKGSNAAKRAGHRTADGMRSAGGAIEKRLPAGRTNQGNTSEAGTQTQR